MQQTPRWWLLVACFATSLVLGMAGLGLAGWTVRQLCDVISAQVAVYEETPPTTLTGQRLNESWRDLNNRIC